MQYTGLSVVFIDEQGRVSMQSHSEKQLHDQDTVILEPEEAYHLYLFLSQHKDRLKPSAAPQQQTPIDSTLGVARSSEVRPAVAPWEGQQYI
ncbi:MAG: hypothetical protein PVSMB2_28540 [Ktedonobacteraceae bacterium]